MIEYRKHKSGREFFMISDETILRVKNKEKWSLVDVSTNQLIKWEATDTDFTKPCTEQEFKEALQVALDRINKMKIV
jgi:hypothetical protein